jgi:hemerythrin-like domain-containing protein
MTWIDHYREDHKAVLLLLAKLDGNIREIEKGQARPNNMLEFEEFGEVIKKVIIPHFKGEEDEIYPNLVQINPSAAKFVEDMLGEHHKLHQAFGDFLEATEQARQEKLVQSGKVLLQLLKKHIEKEEDVIPKLRLVDHNPVP